MAASRRLRPVHLIALALVLVPVWKIVQPFVRPGPKAVSRERGEGGA